MWSSASSCCAAAAGEGDASPGRILSVTGARRDMMAAMERDCAPTSEDGEPGMSLPHGRFPAL